MTPRYPINYPNNVIFLGQHEEVDLYYDYHQRLVFAKGVYWWDYFDAPMVAPIQEAQKRALQAGLSL